jgi:hypothetical protein
MVEPEMSIARLQIGKHAPATKKYARKNRVTPEGGVFYVVRGPGLESKNEFAGDGQQPFTRKRNRPNVESRGREKRGN